MRGRADTVRRCNGKRRNPLTLDNNQLIAEYRMPKPLILEEYTMLHGDLKKQRNISILHNANGLATSFSLFNTWLPEAFKMFQRFHQRFASNIE